MDLKDLFIGTVINQTIPAKAIEKIYIYELLSASFQAIKRLFILVYDATDDNEAGIKNNRKYFLPKRITEKCSEFINDRNFYDQQNNGLIKQYDKVRKVLT